MRNLRFLLVLSALLATNCSPPKALIQADVDPHFNLQKTTGLKIYIVLKEDTVEEKKFSFFLEEELKRQGFALTASPELADFHLLYALNLENYKTKEFMLLSNPEYVSGTFNGRGFTAQRNAYHYEPVERARALKELHLDLYQGNHKKLEKVWSGLLRIDNDDYRNNLKGCVEALAGALGKDMNEKVSIKREK